MIRDPLRNEANEKEKMKRKRDAWKSLGVKGRFFVFCSRLRLWKTRLFLWADRTGTLPSWKEVIAYEEKKAFDESVMQIEKEELVLFREYVERVIKDVAKVKEVHYD